jgi:ribosomal protein S6
MSNYEILILTKMEVVEATVQKFLTETLKVKDLKIQKLENNELAYPIKKETHANYFLCNTKADPSLITELTRKLNIKKDFLRYLVINLDLEKGLKPKKNRPNRN